MVISPEEYRHLHRLNVEKLIALCEKVGAEAKANGLADEILAELLAGDD